MNTEATLRAFALIGLAAALGTVGVLAVRAGVIGGGNPAPALTATAAAQAVTTPTGSFAPAPDSSGSGSASGSLANSATGSSDAGAARTSPTSTTATKTYTVQNGDTFYSLARKFSTTIANIQKLNPGIDPQNLKPGVKITVPAS